MAYKKNTLDYLEYSILMLKDIYFEELKKNGISENSKIIERKWKTLLELHFSLTTDFWWKKHNFIAWLKENGKN